MIKAKKSLGQNFLIDKNILEKIVNTTEIKDRIIFDYNNQLDDQKLKDYLIYLKENSSITRYDFQ